MLTYRRRALYIVTTFDGMWERVLYVSKLIDVFPRFSIQTPNKSIVVSDHS